MLMRQVYFSVYNLPKPSLFKDAFAMVVQKSKQRVSVLTCNEDGSDKLPLSLENTELHTA
jgi:hypothetical protein